MRIHTVGLIGLALMAMGGHAHAQGGNCAGVPQMLPASASYLAPVSAELVSLTEQMSVTGGVLSRAYDESQSVEQVLLRMRVESCRTVVASAAPAATGVDPNDPATYKPRSEFDNAPWRFDMTQNGKRMTADEFTAWLESRGLRVSTGVPITAPQAEQPQPEQP